MKPPLNIKLYRHQGPKSQAVFNVKRLVVAEHPKY